MHVTGDMGHYLTSTALDMGLGDFNRKDLIAATFMKHNDKGNRVESVCVCLSVCLSVCVSVCSSVCHSIFLSVFLMGVFIDKLKFWGCKTAF